ncbi:LysM peptidoglycan-binding domain-containing protein [Croceiramulus getboli]|nr:LysM peptidoglycan-binding domain-containing protein [Flavobacteriaceae bacterium YJPT1-3]
MNKHFWCACTFFLCGCLLSAQDTPISGSPAPVQEEIAEIASDTLTVIDTLTTTIVDREFSFTTVATSKKDSVIFRLEDNAYAHRLDSLWVNELVDYSLYDTIAEMVHNLDYSAVEYEELPTDTLKKRLAAINARTPFNVEYNPALESVIKRYLKRHRPTMERLMAVSEFYFPMFEETLDRYDIPLEMKYLAIVESALRPRARSRVGATGLWQFMFGTGKMYGLDVSSYVDERMDPLLATEAASQYLSKLYEMFDDWDLALASYNSGPGNVSKAIRRSGGRKNYWNIRHNLPRETAGYVPAFLATMYLFEYAEEHGYKKLAPPINFYKTDTIRVKQMITLPQVAKITGLPLDELQFLNPSYKLDIIPFVHDENYVLRLPVEAVGPFVNNETAIYAFAKAELEAREQPLPAFQEAESRIRYRVRSGDYLGKIAERYGVSVSQIKSWNGLRSTNLRIGQRLTIYPRKPAPAVTQAATVTTNTASGKRYTVQSGDSLWKISQKFPGTTVEKLKSWNGIRGNNLKPGMTLIVSKS